MKVAKSIGHILALAILTAVSGASLSAKEPDYSSLDAVIAAEMKEKHTPGAVVAVISDDRVVYAKAFGLANVETKAAMERDMLFRLGSTTKMFTAAALLVVRFCGGRTLGKVKGLSPFI
ncbi:MAG TPA: serine hydrolase domain-containing protein [Pyrinomonadaceae bacterium]|nr:serine hydrolase domain-containing protein [Pyrinomonadaceae bacterium]